MQVSVSLDEKEIRRAIADYVEKQTRVSIQPGDVKVEVKSKQNYRSEWEVAAIRCEFTASGT